MRNDSDSDNNGNGVIDGDKEIEPNSTILSLEAVRKRIVKERLPFPDAILNEVQRICFKQDFPTDGADWINIYPPASKLQINWDRNMLSGAVTGFSEIHNKVILPNAHKEEKSPEVDWENFIQSESLQINPPGFSRGIDFGIEMGTSVSISMASLITDLSNIEHIPADTAEAENKGEKEILPSNTSHNIDNILAKVSPNEGYRFTRPSTRQPINKTIQSWARLVDANHVPADFEEIVPKLAFDYPFELDPFQKQAVYHLERGDSVFIAAHTSAGKTAVAEYAISLAQKHLTKAIYTSPIKALSNQKFRDFKKIFGDVGLLTGDVQLDADASCLIMTTEILRSMLYKSADLIRDVEFVIFDEIHYVNDLERGVVWEEVIIMLPTHVNLIMLSATSPNTLEFADWVGRTKQREIYVISTLTRPVPLEHYLYVAAGAKGKSGQPPLVKIVDANKTFSEAGFKQALQLIKGDELNKKGNACDTKGNKLDMPNNKPAFRGKVIGSSTGTQGGIFRGSAQERNLWIDVIYALRKSGLLPTVVFTFSKRRCEENADGLSSIDLNSSGEKSVIHVFLEASLKKLKGSDAQLPQINRMRELLSRGIAVHHSGLLPIMKEAVEILFSRGLVKVLFATETFAMGVNMPAKTVVFSSIRKHDGTGFRNLLPGEYTQMAGRAGRRGLDLTGTVIIACTEEIPAEITLRQIILGQPTKLTSQFRLTYNMILNLLRVESVRVEEMIKKSFSENIGQKNLPLEQARLAEGEAQLGRIELLSCQICVDIENGGDLPEYYSLCVSVLKYGSLLFERIINDTKLSFRYFESGRIIVINKGVQVNVPAVILKVDSGSMGNANAHLVCLTLARRKEPSAEINDIPEEMLPLPPSYVAIPNDDKAYCYKVLQIGPKELVKVTISKLGMDQFTTPTHISSAYQPNDLERLRGQLLEFFRNPPQGWDNELAIPSLRQLEFDEKRLERHGIFPRLAQFQCLACPDLLEHYAKWHVQQRLTEKLAKLRFQLSDGNLLLIPEYQTRISVLKAMEYIDTNGNVLIKGRVACEINTANELITTELLFSNAFAEYQAAEIIALLSCMVFQERHADAPTSFEIAHLQQGYDKIIETAKNLVTIQRDLGLDIAMDQMLGSLNFGLVLVIYQWALGRPFIEITGLTNVLEGSIVRCVVRLDETCRELKNAAKIMGDPTLYRKMEEASIMIKRDICFASSLYLL